MLELFGLNLWIELKLLKKPTLYENTRNDFGAITLPLRESRLSQLVGDAERGQKTRLSMDFEIAKKS